MKKLFTSLVAVSTATTLAACGKTTTTNTKTTTTEKVKPEDKTTSLPSYTRGVKQPAITKGTFKIEDELFKSLVISEEQQGDDPVRLPAEKISEPETEPAIATEGSQGLEIQENSESQVEQEAEDEINASRETIQLEALGNIYKELGRLTQQPEYDLVQKKQALNNIYKELSRLRQEVWSDLDAKKEAIYNLYIKFDELAREVHELAMEVRDELVNSPDPIKAEAFYKLYTKFHELWKKARKEVIKSLENSEQEEQEAEGDLVRLLKTEENSEREAKFLAAAEALDNIHKELGRLRQEVWSDLGTKQEAFYNLYTQLDELKQEILNELDDESSETSKLETLENIYTELNRITQQSGSDLVQKKQALTKLYIKFNKLVEEVQDELDESPNDTKQEALDGIRTQFNRLISEVGDEVYTGQTISEQQAGYNLGANEEALYNLYTQFYELEQEILSELNEPAEATEAEVRFLAATETLENIYTELNRITQQPGSDLDEKQEALYNLHTQLDELKQNILNDLDESPDTAKQEALENIYTELNRITQQPGFDLDEKQTWTKLYIKFNKLVEKVQYELDESPNDTKQEALDGIRTQFNRLISEVGDEIYKGQTISEQQTGYNLGANEVALYNLYTKSNELEQEILSELNKVAEAKEAEVRFLAGTEQLDNTHKELVRLMQEVESDTGTTVEALFNRLIKLNTKFNELTKEVQGDIVWSSDATKQKALNQIYENFFKLSKEVRGELNERSETQSNSDSEEQEAEETLEQEILNESDESSETIQLEALDNTHKELVRLMQEVESDTGTTAEALFNKLSKLNTKFNELAKEVQDDLDESHELDESPDTAKQEALVQMHTKFNKLFTKVENVIYDKKTSVWWVKHIRTRRNLKKQAGDELNGSLETEENKYLKDIEALTKFYENYYTKLGWNKKSIRNKVAELLAKIKVARKIEDKITKNQNS